MLVNIDCMTMNSLKVSDVNITINRALPSPLELLGEVEKNDQHRSFVAESRQHIHDIIFGSDRRLLLVVGPCSIHDVAAGKEFANRLVKLASEVNERIFIVMRAYFEKPRTSIGWKGLIMDPHLDGTYDIPTGLRTAREFLRHVIELGMPTATELLDPITPQYIADLICWSCIGARTTESQTHRQMASGLSMPLGFKNGTDGNLTAAINAIKAASQPQTFLGIDQKGIASAVTTRGNPNCHAVLRGGSKGPNFSSEHVSEAAKQLEKHGLVPAVMVDCSHGNSNKDYRRQPKVLEDIVTQLQDHASPIIGAMLESNLFAGNQPFPQSSEEIQYGISITDACIDFETTERIVRQAFDALAPRFA